MKRKRKARDLDTLDEKFLRIIKEEWKRYDFKIPADQLKSPITPELEAICEAQSKELQDFAEQWLTATANLTNQNGQCNAKERKEPL